MIINIETPTGKYISIRKFLPLFGLFLCTVGIYAIQARCSTLWSGRLRRTSESISIWIPAGITSSVVRQKNFPRIGSKELVGLRHDGAASSMLHRLFHQEAGRAGLEYAYNNHAYLPLRLWISDFSFIVIFFIIFFTTGDTSGCVTIWDTQMGVETSASESPLLSMKSLPERFRCRVNDDCTNGVRWELRLILNRKAVWSCCCWCNNAKRVITQSALEAKSMTFTLFFLLLSSLRSSAPPYSIWLLFLDLFF